MTYTTIRFREIRQKLSKKPRLINYYLTSNQIKSKTFMVHLRSSKTFMDLESAKDLAKSVFAHEDLQTLPNFPCRANIVKLSL